MPDKVERRSAEGKGFGIFARRNFKKGELVIRDEGMEISFERYFKLPKAHQHWSVQVSDSTVLIPKDVAHKEDLWFVNHSCDPNTTWGGNGCWIARRDIKKGEEITHDYALLWTNDVDKFRIRPCLCGSKVCRGELTERDWQHPQVLKQHRGHLPDFIQEKIRKMQLETV